MSSIKPSFLKAKARLMKICLVFPKCFYTGWENVCRKRNVAWRRAHLSVHMMRMHFPDMAARSQGIVRRAGSGSCGTLIGNAFDAEHCLKVVQDDLNLLPELSWDGRAKTSN